MYIKVLLSKLHVDKRANITTSLSWKLARFNRRRNRLGQGEIYHALLCDLIHLIWTALWKYKAWELESVSITKINKVLLSPTFIPQPYFNFLYHIRDPFLVMVIFLLLVTLPRGSIRTIRRNCGTAYDGIPWWESAIHRSSLATIFFLNVSSS